MASLLFTHHHQDGDIRVYQQQIWSGIQIYLDADPGIPLYGWTDVCDSNSLDSEIMQRAQALLLSFISVVYETDWE